MILTIWTIGEDRYGQESSNKNKEYLNISEIRIKNGILIFEDNNGKEIQLGPIYKNIEIQIEEVG